MYKPDMVFSKNDIVGRAAVYLFWLGNLCQYVGDSRDGLRRPLGSSHPARGFEWDKMEVIWQPDYETAHELQNKLIDELSPQVCEVGVGFIPTRSSDIPYRCYDPKTRDHLVMSKEMNGIELFRGKNKEERNRFWRDARKQARQEQKESFKQQARERALL